MKTTLILTGGMIERDFALSFIQEKQPDFILGIDRGLLFCYENGIRPDYIIGDFDSVPLAVLNYYRCCTDIPVKEYNPVKDATDTHIALEKAMDLGSEEIWILGATGGRLDHFLCNLQILKNAWERKCRVWIVDSQNLITLVTEKELKLKRSEQFGKYVSFFPLEKEVVGLTLKGFKYPLDQYCLRNQEGLGVSNEIVEETAEVSWKYGILVMIQSRD